ncbi:MAG: hypothetical protein JW934_21555 [Anaerolineae bacterium]|nr:hypothetical protein [Anaerolineae bacterium]
MEHRERKGSLFGPLLLVLIGVVFLLNNFGLVEWDIWLQLLRLWPIFIIGAGLDMLFGRRSMAGSFIVGVLLIALLAGGVWYLSAQTPDGPERVEEVSYGLEGVDKADVHIGFGVGTLKLGALGDSRQLIEGKADLSRGETLLSEHQVKGNKATLTLDSKISTPLNYPNSYAKNKVWALNLSSGVQLSLDVDTGVGMAELDLRRLDVSDLSIDSGVGKTTILLPQEGRFDVEIKAGVGEVIIQVPEGLEVQINVDPGLGGIEVPESYRRSGDTYTSPGYGSAADRADIEINGGVGRIVIREYKGE